MFDDGAEVILLVIGAVLISAGLVMLVLRVGAGEGTLNFKLPGFEAQASTPGLAVLAVGAIVLIVPFFTPGSESNANSDNGSTTPSPTAGSLPEVISKGRIVLRNPENAADSDHSGFDLDTRSKATGYPGSVSSTDPVNIDISLLMDSGMLVMKSNPRTAVALVDSEPPGPGEDGCKDAIATGDARISVELSELKDLRSTAGQSSAPYLCVRTDENRISQLEITAVSLIAGSIELNQHTFEKPGD